MHKFNYSSCRCTGTVVDPLGHIHSFPFPALHDSPIWYFIDTIRLLLRSPFQRKTTSIPEKNFKAGTALALKNLHRSLQKIKTLDLQENDEITIRHDYLQAHLFKIGLADSPLWPLCKSVPMTGEHLSDCPALLHVLSQENCGVLLPARATSALY
ncbi:hypothetical protein TNCV_2969631 [Trichonephila clavipes]|nr:hypothetical protein TNCV_2969631 [Trichonephila clavipes]